MADLLAMLRWGPFETDVYEATDDGPSTIILKLAPVPDWWIEEKPDFMGERGPLALFYFEGTIFRCPVAVATKWEFIMGDSQVLTLKLCRRAEYVFNG